ncbi:MAG: hypothetical protein FJ152_04095 [Firmicutes bacterium]|nr:hypothetical protein [Bacillota bacterium]
MRNWPPIIAFLSLIVLLMISAQVTAQDESRFSHTMNYEIGGRISISREIGQACTTGAVKYTNINGYGEMSKYESIRIAKNIMNIDEVSNWSVPVGAIEGLTVTTTIKLCNRPMTAAAEVYGIDDPLTPFYDERLQVGTIINVYDPQVVDGTIKVYNLTDQIWATSLSTNPGNKGSYHADFVAAYGPGPYEKLYGYEDKFGNIYFPDEEFMWEYDPTVAYFDRNHRTLGYERGKYYVGNYFNIEQYAHTTGGALRRYISISEPFENTYLEEEMSVIGSASVREALKMDNLIRGKKGVTLLWYELF